MNFDMAHYIDAEQLKAELDKRYAEYRTKMKTDDFTYYEGMADALDLFEQYIDTFPEQPVEGLEEEITRYLREECSSDNEPSVSEIARHFAEWGRKDKEDK